MRGHWPNFSGKTMEFPVQEYFKKNVGIKEIHFISTNREFFSGVVQKYIHCSYLRSSPPMRISSCRDASHGSVMKGPRCTSAPCAAHREAFFSEQVQQRQLTTWAAPCTPHIVLPVYCFSHGTGSRRELCPCFVWTPALCPEN